MIVGTAGHIDHGKTTLVRALTGIDTDRLPEEKARGISIDLGYAYAPLANGDMLGFVDVPGHERFVHTMLAGATGIDFALLVVAADDGVMPQTREHLNILALLGIDAGAIVVTKIDVVDAVHVAAVERDLRRLVSRTPLADSPVFTVSSRTGAGVDELRSFLQQRAMVHLSREDHGRHFRLAVDRSFTLPGIGTVVTGTVHSGDIRIGESVIVAPSAREVRVRGIHAQNRQSDRGAAGQRCALNLAGIARDEIARGDWIVAPSIALQTQRVDAQVSLLVDESRSLRTGATVQVHVGAVNVSARLVILDTQGERGNQRDEIAPGGARLVQLVLQRSIGAWHGDRFILRDTAASRTIGGGHVLDPFAPARYRRSPDRLTVLAALQAPSAAERLALLIARAPHGIDLAQFACGGNVRDPGRLLPSLGARRVVGRDAADFAIGEDHWRALQMQVHAALVSFHRDHPDELGPDVTRLKRIAFPRLSDALYRAVIAELIAAGKVERGGPWLHLPGHDNAPSPQERALVDKVLPRLLDAAFDPPWVRDLAKDASQPEALLRSTLIRASKRGEVYQVVRDLFYHPAAIRELASVANRLHGSEGDVRAAVFRDETGLGRKRAIQILEFFDRVGFTRRVRDKHIVRADSLLVASTASDATRVGAIDAN
jgi:selenocysteine-specific elongation factor